MSWRFLFAVLALLMAASAWSGLRLGEWLVANGPLASSAPGQPEITPVEVLGADGKPFAAQPPQPQVNGRLAIPQPPEPVAWEITPESLNELFANNLIPIATTRISMAEAEQIAALESGKLMGIADVGDLISSMEKRGNRDGNMPIQPVEIPDFSAEPGPGPASTPAPPAVANTGWLNQLRDELQACNAQSFFDRPSCAWAARNKYCTPNSAWGYVAECPAKSF